MTSNHSQPADRHDRDPAHSTHRSTAKAPARLILERGGDRQPIEEP
jgi:hypothetical protein